MLDSCSQLKTFIKEHVQKKLGAVCREAGITVKTLNDNLQSGLLAGQLFF